jgi:hypothetical protein
MKNLHLRDRHNYDDDDLISSVTKNNNSKMGMHSGDDEDYGRTRKVMKMSASSFVSVNLSTYRSISSSFIIYLVLIGSLNVSGK